MLVGPLETLIVDEGEDLNYLVATSSLDVAAGNEFGMTPNEEILV